MHHTVLRRGLRYLIIYTQRLRKDTKDRPSPDSVRIGLYTPHYEGQDSDSQG